jgi:hypothetical protein
MSLNDIHLVGGVTCDVRGCTAEIMGKAMPYFDGRTHYQQLSESQGWTWWASRGLRVYCSDHQPGLTHTMRRLSPGRPLLDIAEDRQGSV